MRVLFVCTGNICRSPTADGVFRRMVADAGLACSVRVDSAGTHGYHIGDAPDPRSVEAAARRGYDLSSLRARKVEQADFDRFELIVAMDQGHLSHLERMCPAGHAGKLVLMMNFSDDFRGRDVPDPYYGGESGFEVVLDMIEDALIGLLQSVRASGNAVPL